MSKAFTKEANVEDDDLSEAESALPRGAKNYITSEGH